MPCVCPKSWRYLKWHSRSFRFPHTLPTPTNVLLRAGLCEERMLCYSFPAALHCQHQGYCSGAGCDFFRAIPFSATKHLFRHRSFQEHFSMFPIRHLCSSDVFSLSRSLKAVCRMFLFFQSPNHIGQALPDGAKAIALRFYGFPPAFHSLSERYGYRIFFFLSLPLPFVSVQGRRFSLFLCFHKYLFHATSRALS